MVGVFSPPLDSYGGVIKANDGVSGVGQYYTTLGIILVFLLTCVYNNT